MKAIMIGNNWFRSPEIIINDNILIKENDPILTESVRLLSESCQCKKGIIILKDQLDLYAFRYDNGKLLYLNADEDDK